MLIVEGPDGAGKTTLISEIAQRFPDNSTVRKSIGPRPAFMIRDEVYGHLGAEVRATDGSVSTMKIFDRFYFSEVIYGNIIRGDCAFTRDEQRTVTAMIRALRIPIILCLPPIGVVEENWENRSDDKAGVGSLIHDIYRAYANLQSFHRTFIYDYTADENKRNLKMRVILDDLNSYMERKAIRYGSAPHSRPM